MNNEYPNGYPQDGQNYNPAPPYGAPVPEQPYYPAPAEQPYQAPVEQQPVYQAPVEQPVYQAPVYQAPPSNGYPAQQPYQQQPYQQQPYQQSYQQPYQPAYNAGSYYAPAAEEKPKAVFKVLGIIGMVFGIISLPLFWVPVWDLILSIIGLVLSAVGKKSRSGMATAGLVLSIIATALSIIFYLVIFESVGSYY